jgi:hypothetical protein
MYYGTSSLPFGSPSNNGSGLYSVKISYDDNNTPKLTNITGINNWNNYISKPIYNASYWNNASGSGGYWYMSEATGVLSKIAFTTQGSGLSIVPTSFKSFTLTVPVLPNLYDNQFGDISISGSSSSGYLYATTRFGFLYCFNLTPTMIGQNPVYVTGMKITGDAAGKTLQTTFNNSNNILYGHHYDTQTWYTIDTNLDSFGNTNIIKSTSDQNVILPQFTDMCGGTSCTVGSVATGYKVSSYAVTNQEYVNFLNSVDPSGLSTQLTPYDNGYGQNSTASTGILYTYLMSSDRGGVLYVANNLLGNKYTVKKYMDTKPAVFITWPMAARYCNWLHNRVSDPHSNINTNGAYNFNAVSYDGGLSSNTGLIRNQNAKYFLPNIHEWYKSAYYSLNKNPSGYNLYATQSDSPPTCIEADEYGEGPHWINDVKQVIFNDLSVGDSYTLYLSITKPSKYDAFLTTTVIEFKANKTSEKILIPITRYSTVLAIILTTKLVNNAGRVVDERNHLVACPGINTGCLARLPRTPLPTSTVTPSITATVTRTPSGTRQPSTPTPTNTVTKTGTPTPSVTSTITPSVTVTSSKPQSIIYACNFVDSSNNYDIMSGTYNKQSDSEYRKDNNLTGYKIYYNGSNSRWELANNAGTAFYYASSIFGVWRSTSAVTQYPADSVGFWQVATSPCSDRDTFV